MNIDDAIHILLTRTRYYIPVKEEEDLEALNTLIMNVIDYKYRVNDETEVRKAFVKLMQRRREEEDNEE